MPIISPYENTNEMNLTELLEHFDSNVIFDMIEKKLEVIDFTNVIPEPNAVQSFEQIFKYHEEVHPADAANIRMIRQETYINIINILCGRFNLQFNEDDDNIDRYMAAYWLYDFLICKRSIYMVNFFVSFIVCNKDSLYQNLNLEEYRKSRDSAASYSKRIYTDPKYGIIAANIDKVLDHIAPLGFNLYNIFQSIYNPDIVAFMDNAFADKGDFFTDFYYNVIIRPEIKPMAMTSIRLALQSVVGDISSQSIKEIISYNGGTQND